LPRSRDVDGISQSNGRIIQQIMDNAAYSEMYRVPMGTDHAPVCLLALTGREAQGDHQRPAADPGLAHTLMELLSDAERCLTADRTGARWSIARARSLLEAEWPERAKAAPAAPTGGLPPRTVRRLEAYIDENLGNRIRVVDLAQIARLSACYFSRAFRQSFGRPPHAYIVRRRIERAQQLMLRTNEPLCQIALDCGLADQAHLSKLFRRVRGETPAAWRKRQMV
jgi:AraC family transcriptional regulator